MPAAVAAQCAGEQGKFWEMYEKIFANQRALSDDQLKGYATEAGVAMTSWESCYKEQKPKGQIIADQRTSVQLGARGTPAFFINGRFLSGAQPFPAFDKLVSEELKKAKASGIPRSEYYSKAIVAKGLKRL